MRCSLVTFELIRAREAFGATWEEALVSSLSVSQSVAGHVRRIACREVASWPSALERLLASMGARVCFQLAAIRK